MGKKYKVGDVIKLKKEHSKEIDSRFDDIKAMQVEIDSMAKRIYLMKEKIWIFIREIKPEFADCELSYDIQKKHIIIKAIDND